MRCTKIASKTINDVNEHIVEGCCEYAATDFPQKILFQQLPSFNVILILLLAIYLSWDQLSLPKTYLQ